MACTRGAGDLAATLISLYTEWKQTHKNNIDDVKTCRGANVCRVSARSLPQVTPRVRITAVSPAAPWPTSPEALWTECLIRGMLRLVLLGGYEASRKSTWHCHCTTLPVSVRVTGRVTDGQESPGDRTATVRLSRLGKGVRSGCCGWGQPRSWLKLKLESGCHGHVAAGGAGPWLPRP